MKVKIIFLYFVIALLVDCQEGNASTLVYNMRVRRALNLNAVLHKDDKGFWAFSGAPIVSTRTRKIDVPDGTCVHEKNIIAGALFDLRWIPTKEWWLEVTTGLEGECVRATGTRTINNSRVGLDDIVFAGGYNFFLNDDLQFVLYGLTGIPTRWKVTADEVYTVPVGSRLFGAGFGAELSYSFIQSKPKSLIAVLQTRFIHFFAREWFPILPCGAKIQPGETIDVLGSLKYRYKRNAVEAGYNPTFFANQGVLLKKSTTISAPFVRHSLFINGLHVLEKTPDAKTLVAIGAGFNASWSKKFDTRIYTYWASVGVLF
ncbi:MAG: hypothetical protein NTX86_03845 [Candidatus Dependentiae bacterium]|nr:hypothetical protein [Candidatus Dependentiae bacterium]